MILILTQSYKSLKAEVKKKNEKDIRKTGVGTENEIHLWNECHGKCTFLQNVSTLNFHGQKELQHINYLVLGLFNLRISSVHLIWELKVSKQ